MSHKQMPRLGSAIASTILSVFSAVSLVGVDKAQAAVLKYNINLDGGPSGFVKVDNSSVTGIDFEGVAISEGRLYGFTSEGEEYYDLAGFSAIFAEGDFFGVLAYGSYSSITDEISPPDEPGGPSFFRRIEINGQWTMRPTSFLDESVLAHRQVNYQSYIDDGSIVTESYLIYSRSRYEADISYTLVGTEPSPVPEPLTSGGTALALAGLSWLKHKKKTAA